MEQASAGYRRHADSRPQPARPGIDPRGILSRARAPTRPGRLARTLRGSRYTTLAGSERCSRAAHHTGCTADRMRSAPSPRAATGPAEATPPPPGARRPAAYRQSSGAGRMNTTPSVTASPVAARYADIAASRRSAGRPVAPADCLIAAIARSRDMTVATRADQRKGPRGVYQKRRLGKTA